MSTTSLSNLTRNNTSVPYLIVICGATATGKSGLAIALAQRFCETKRIDTAILSADSRQVYREFNIGTAKPSIAEQQQVSHYLIDICDPTETLTVAEYQQQAQALIEGEEAEGRRQKAEGKGGESEVRSQESAVSSQHSALSTQHELETQNFYFPIPHSLLPTPYSPLPTPLTPPQSGSKLHPLLLVGGTGLYIRSIVRGLKIPRVAPQLELRSQLQALGQSQLFALLQQVDPDGAAKIHPNDQVRTLRSLEVFYVTGCPMSAQQGEQPPTYPILQIGLDCQSVEQSDRRIEQRTEQMFAAGLVQEVEHLCQKYGTDLPLLNTLGYAECKQYLAGELSLNETQKLIVLHTRQFAKRQRTWFRADPAIVWFDANSPTLLEQVWQCIQPFLNHHQ